MGDGTQTKSYVNVQDCVEAMYLAEKKEVDKVEVYNIGDTEFITVKQSINYITSFMNVKPRLIFGGGKRGWIGDSPVIHLDNNKIKSLGWNQKFSIRESIEQTIEWLLQNKWVYKKRQ